MSAEIGGLDGATIRKDVRTLAPPPNLIDYEAACREFSWERARSFLEGLPEGRGLNIAHEAVDRHAKGARAERTALRWLGKAGEKRDISYRELSEATNRFANALRRPRRRRGGTRVHFAWARPRALCVRTRRAQGEMRRLAAVFRVRAGAARDPSRAGRGSSPRHHAGVLSPQGGGHARATAQARPCPADRRRGNGAGNAVLAAPDGGGLRGFRDSADLARRHGAHSFHQRNHRPTERRRSRPRGDRHALRDWSLRAGSARRRYLLVHRGPRLGDGHEL